MISVEKPGSPAEILEHHGTKGMKWGVRQTNNARFNIKNPTRHEKSKAIRTARARQNVRLTNYGTEKFGKTRGQRKELKKVYLKHPDRATALRMTRGEKIVAGILAVGLPGPGTAAVAGVVGTQYAMRRRIEKKQARGGYG